MPQPLTTGDFVARWSGRKLTERAAAQSHFSDLCELLGVPAPTDNPLNDSDYGFEARTNVSASGVYATRTGEDGMPLYQVETGPGPGFVDVWKRDHFCWEYKRPGKHADLAAALVQLKIYRDSLGNPPLLIVSDINRTEIHTNFNGYPPTVYAFDIGDLLAPSDQWKQDHPKISPLEVLRKVFDDPQWFRPSRTTAAITEDLAGQIGKIAIALRDAGNDPHAVAHYLMQIVFCLFAEDIDLLPRRLFKRLVERSVDDPRGFTTKARSLFKAMEGGGHFGADTVEWFNGGLFKNVDNDPVIDIPSAWLGQLRLVAEADWTAVEPSILGTLFERSLDPGKRSQIGAHYTSRDDIMLIVEPVVMQPLRRKWVQLQKDVAEWLEQKKQPEAKAARKASLTKKIRAALETFCDELASVTVLDPACGSGNFLYVTIQQLLNLELEVHAFAARPEIDLRLFPRVQPSQLMGIEINDYACELARVSIWIGYLQWLHANAGPSNRRPILDPLDTIEHRDAILKWTDAKGRAIPVWHSGAQCAGAAEWPKADCVIGNPPFLGSNLFRQYGLTEDYVHAMYGAFELPRASDLCCYWFEQGRKAIEQRRAGRVGLLATQGIRGKDNRVVLERIKQIGDIFMAWADRDWILDGAAVHVSMIGFDGRLESTRTLDGDPVRNINVDLTATVDTTVAARLAENEGVYCRAPEKGGKFELDWEQARQLLMGNNPNRKPNSEVVRPWVNGETLISGKISDWIIDFGEMSEFEASQYQKPFEYVLRHVKPFRQRNRYESLRSKWWQYRRPGSGVREAADRMPRLLATTMVAKHRLFIWLDSATQPDKTIVVFARSDDYFFGAMHSATHEVWARKMGTQLREVESGFRYTPTDCFETFPLPWPPGKEPDRDPRFKAIAAAAKELNVLRQNWLLPSDDMERVADNIDRFEDFSGVPDDARPLLRQSAIMAKAATDRQLGLGTLTLTSLYNERPGWLKLAHRKLDEAVLTAYAAVDPQGGWDPAWATVYEPYGAGEIVIVEKGKNKDNAETVAAKKAAIEARKPIDERILANLLRLNLARAAQGDQPAA